MTFLKGGCLSICLLLQCLLSISLLGNQPDMRFINLQKEDGLSGNSILDIVKDQRGFIWIATTDGLCRYDAHQQMKVFHANPSQPNQLQTNNIRSLFSDSKNNLWIGTRLAGLTKYNHLSDTWTTYQHNPDDKNSLSNDEVLSIYEDNKGRIWVGTEDGLNLFVPETESFLTFKIDKSNPSALQGKAILSITEDHRGYIWIGTWAGGLHLFLPDPQNLANSTFRNILPSAQKGAHNVWKIYQDQANRMWLGTLGKGLFLMQVPDTISNLPNQQDWKPSFVNYDYSGNHAHSISNNDIKDICQDDKGNLWIATSEKLNFIPAVDLLQLDKKETKKIPLTFHKYGLVRKDNSSLISSSVTKIFQDDQSLIWIGTTKGVSIYNWQIHQIEFVELKLPEKYDFYDNNLYISKQGKLFLGSFTKGILEYETKDHTFKTLLDKTKSYISNIQINCLYGPNDLDFYLGTKNGIIHFDRRTSTTTAFPISNWLKGSVKEFHVKSLHKEKTRNRLWIATHLGLFMVNLDNGDYTHFEHLPKKETSISDNSINDIFEDSYGDLWITSYNGLNRISKKQLAIQDPQKIAFQRYKHNGKEGGLPFNRLTTIAEKEGQLYIGSTAGLFAYNYATKQFINYTEQGCSSWILAIQPTDSGNLWCSTKEGILQFNPNTFKLKTYGKKDGLADFEFRYGANFMDEHGFIYFCSQVGYVKFHPKNIQINNKPPDIYITDARKMNPEGVENLSLLNKHRLNLSPNDYYLSLRFAGLNYNQPNKNQYAYQLEGFDESWIYTNSNNPVVYTNLKPGDYSFRVKGANNDGIWNEKETTLSINKAPAFWQTNLFYVLLFIGLSTLIGLSFLLYSKNLHRHYQAIEGYNKKLNKEIKERKKVEKVIQSKNLELSRSNHDLEQFAYIASHDLQAPLVTIKNFTGLIEKTMPDRMTKQEQEFLGFISKSVGNMQALVTDLLTFSRINTQKRKIQTVNLPKLIDNIIIELDATLKEANAQIQVLDFPEYIEADKIKLKQLLQNLIINGIKFSKPGVPPVVKVSCKEQGAFWKFEVKDNGIGISKEFNKKIFQLFQRLHTSEKYKGTGIGLALCKKIVEQHEGEIYVDSELGMGCNFIFTINRSLN